MPKITSKKSLLSHYDKKKTIAKYPKAPIVEEEERTCTICFDDIDMESDRHDKALKRKERNERFKAHLDCCKHTFHVGCIKKWFETENSCPNCKKKCTSLMYKKPNCKRKMETISVENKRQRPDHDDHNVRDDAYAVIIRMLRSDYAMVLTRAPCDDDLEDDINFLVPRGRSQALFGRSYFFNDIPYQMMYTLVARSIIMTLFVRSAPFRTMVLHLLNVTVDELTSPMIRTNATKAHMIFNVILRSWTHLRTPRANVTAIGSWMDEAMFAVYGINRHTHTSSDDPFVVVDESTRPWHPQLTPDSFNCTRNEFIVEAFAHAEGRNVNEITARQRDDESFDDYLNRIYII